MFNLTEAYKVIGSSDGKELWNGRFACATTNNSKTMLTNQLEDTVAAYTFTLIRRGSLTLETNGQQVHFQENEMYIYLPGYPVKVCSVSDDYKAMVLLVDEQTTYRTSAFRNLIRASYYPIIQYGKPKFTMTADEAQRLVASLQAIHDHIVTPSNFNDEILEMLYSVFLLDLIDMQEQAFCPHPTSRRTEDIFMTFYTLLRQHFVEHHDIGFYAERMHITTTYLSRIVKQTSGRTVADFINQMLAMEATWMLTSSSLTIAQIAERLHFANSPSFDKFFMRMRGKSPSAFRKGE